MACKLKSDSIYGLDKERYMAGGVYKITNTLNGRLYIGSAVSFSKRKKGHFGSLRKGRHVNKKLQLDFDKDGEDVFEWFVLQVVEEPTKDKLVAAEQSFLDSLKPYYNVCETAYSTLGIKHPEESKAKHSEAMKKQMADPKRRKILSDAMKRRLADPVEKGKLRNAIKKGKADPEYRKRASENTKRIMQTPEARERCRTVFLGKKHTPMAKAIMSAAAKKRMESPEIRKQLSDAAKKLWMDPEYRQRVIEAKKLNQSTSTKRKENQC